MDNMELTREESLADCRGSYNFAIDALRKRYIEEVEAVRVAIFNQMRAAINGTATEREIEYSQIASGVYARIAVRTMHGMMHERELNKRIKG